jgi:hypothetical protein
MKRFFILFFIIISIVFAQNMIVRVYAPSYNELKRISEKPVDIAGARGGEWYDIVADDMLLDKIINSGLYYEVRIYDLEYEAEISRAQYLSYEEVNDSLRQMVANYPLICKLDSLPIPTYQGNWIYGIKISDNPDIEEDDEGGFLIDGLHHSREWACIPVVLFFADSILRSYGVVSGITDIIDQNEIYCFPIINADGYLYDYPGQHMWRKNREPACGGIGTDPNRNYLGCSGDIWGDWGNVAGVSVTHNNVSPYGSGLFCGPYANSGDETMALTMYVKSHIINAYMSYHSHAELLMWPWGWTPEPTPHSSLYDQLGNDMADLIERLGGGFYGRGPVYTAIYGVSGSSMDWVYSWSIWLGGIPNLSFTTELGTAFYQPEADLDDICRQNFKALEYLAAFCNFIAPLCEPVVPPPEIYYLGTVDDTFTIYWHAKNSQYNNPSKWQLVELKDPSVIEDDLESGTGRWLLDGFSLSTTEVHSGTYSFFSESMDSMNSAVQTVHPYLVQSGDSVTFWCWYNLETDWDVAVVEVSENTKEWFNLDTTRFTGNSGGWNRKAYSLEDWIGRSVYIRFRAMTDDNTHYSGFYVDDISPVCLFEDVSVISSTITDTFYQFLDHAFGEYYYYVRGFNTTWGWGDYSCLKKANVIGIVETETPNIISENPSFSIYPNPFRQITEIKYCVGRSAYGVERVSLDIYDITGKLVRQFDHKTMRLSDHIVWDGKDNFGRAVPAGIYFINFAAGDYKKIEKAILLR